MSEIIVPFHSPNCPICGQLCVEEETEGYRTVLRKQGMCKLFLCINPLADNPLHYYNHIVDKSESNKIVFQEFSLDLGHRYILFGIDYFHQKSQVKYEKQGTPLELDFIISPDFPDLESLKRKIRTVITFS